MKILIFFSLLIIILTDENCIPNNYLPCLTNRISSIDQNKIISNIKNNQVDYSSEIINELFIKLFKCLYKFYPNAIEDPELEWPVYKYMYRYIFKGESNLLTIHTVFCNNGKEVAIKTCNTLLGSEYNCSKIINSFKKCANDMNDNC